MEFYYQIKGKSPDGYWSWPPLESGLVTANNSKSAREQIEQEHGRKLPGRESKDIPFLLTLIDIEKKPYLKERFIPKACKQCNCEFTDNDKYLVNAGGSREFCCKDCYEVYNFTHNKKDELEYNFNGIHTPVIYKITNKTTGLCYIGKTTQAFTFRWYQHFFQSTNSTKFYEAVKQHPLSDWIFEVIEVIELPNSLIRRERHRLILEREQHYISLYNSIHNGYNSVVSVKLESDIEQDMFTP